MLTGQLFISYIGGTFLRKIEEEKNSKIVLHEPYEAENVENLLNFLLYNLHNTSGRASQSQLLS